MLKIDRFLPHFKKHLESDWYRSFSVKGSLSSGAKLKNHFLGDMWDAPKIMRSIFTGNKIVSVDISGKSTKYKTKEKVI